MANQNILALNLVAAAASLSGPDMENLSGRFAHIIIDITAVTGTTPAMVVTIEGRDERSGKYYPILASASLTAVGTTILRIFPGATAAANVVASDFIPRFFRVSVAIAGTTPAVTAKISANLNG